MVAFAVTWDYRCPFARNAHDHLLTALEAGADWDVEFRAFSLDQPHIEAGQPSVWDEPEKYPGMVVNYAGIVVRDRQPEKFLAVHRALFEARHAHSLDTRKREVVSEVLAGCGVDAAAVMAEIDDGWPVEVARKEHTAGVDQLEVFGVPTFIHGDRAVFVRLLDRADGDAAKATSTMNRIVDMVTGWPELNEFKATQLPV
ncbi:DsbA family protein [Acidiferrimicrobium sp. IK]|uniref:DsbA family oxidoreductase n=1 Tax=Acidiferrimicrobium sp. IK TaxID=2871700 RepID=UPI0021CB79F8|nr:DsbA family protein [Acidiferrimicrobium sp. IK]MCU4184234.1 DsbA family protein [Acidiferrimicrobium sp. IK]